MSARIRPAYARVGAVVLVAALLAAAYALGVFEHVREPRVFAQTLRDLGFGGYVLFVVSYTVLQPFGVPGTVFIVAAPLIWPWPTAFALSMVGTLAASVVGFSFARFVARDWVSARIPARLRRYEAALAEHGFQTVFTLRLLLWMPQVLHFFLGVSRVGFWTHFWGSLLGYVPPLLLVSYLGGELFDDAGRLQTGAWRAFAALAGASLVFALFARRFQRRAAAKGALDPARNTSSSPEP